MTLITSESASQYSNMIAVTTNTKLDPDQLILYINPFIDKFHLGDILRANLTNYLDPETRKNSFFICITRNQKLLGRY